MPATISDARPGLASRARRLRRRRLVLVGIIGVIVALLGAGVWLVGFSSVLALRTVSVHGATLTTQQTVAAAAQGQLGQPLSRVDTQAIATRVAALPAVASVTVTKDWPHGLVIQVTERVPVIQRSTAAGYEWIDASGVAFHTTPTAKAGLVKLTTSSTEQRLYQDAATVAASLSPELRSQTTEITMSSPDTIELVLTGGRRVVWGSADQSPVKSQVATALLRVKAKIYDVSAPANPTSR